MNIPNTGGLVFRISGFIFFLMTALVAFGVTSFSGPFLGIVAIIAAIALLVGI